MDKLNRLNTLVNERLSVAANEIYGAAARIIWEVEHQFKADVSRLQKENERQRKLLDVMLKSDVRLYRTELLHLPVHSEEEVCPEKQKGNCCLDQGDFELPLNCRRQKDLDEASRSKVTSLLMKRNMEENSPPLQRDIHADGEDCEIPRDTSTSVKEETSPVNVLKSCLEPPKDSGKLVKVQSSPVKKLNITWHRTCNVCGKRFTKFSALAKHMRVQHTEGKSCTICCKIFSNEKLLKSHMRVHSTEKPYSCTICEKSFRHRSTLDKHVIIHTGTKPYSCTVCNRRFRQKNHVTKHMTTHTGDKPFKCTICEESFRLKGTMTNHMFRHAGEKAFPCSICGKRLARVDSMVRHMRLHERQPVDRSESDYLEPQGGAEQSPSRAPLD